MGEIKAPTLEGICASNNRFRRLIKFSRIPPNTYYTHRLHNFIARNGAEEAYQLAVDYAAGKAQHHFLSLASGTTGSGKTHLAIAIGWQWLENDEGVVQYWHVPELLDYLRASYDSQEESWKLDQRMAQLKNEIGLLILDDLGTERPTPWAVERLELIVDHRYLNLKATVMTTNQAPEQLPDRIASRFSEGESAVLDCGDYRTVKAALRPKRDRKEGSNDRL